MILIRERLKIFNKINYFKKNPSQFFGKDFLFTGNCHPEFIEG